MANVSLKEAQALAISEARKLNEALGEKRYNTVSMDDHGCWYADECKSSEMIINSDYGFCKAPHGNDWYLHEVPKCDTSICNWEKSVAEVN